jgi:uncharacterized protein (TIGR02594 family)
MTKYNAAILQVSAEALGIEEWPGARHNPEIMQMYRDAGFPDIQADEVPWCAAFVNSVLASVGLPGTGSLLSRSFDTYGAAIQPNMVVPGDIVRIWTESPQSWRGHVGIAVRIEGDRIILRGGNQNNRVGEDPYPISKIVAVRRADGKVAAPTRPALRIGDRGAFVLDLQSQLEGLRYFSGKFDGIFGELTRKAVLAFQADHNLVVDGVVGPQTWNAMEKAEPRELREIDEADLAKSRTIQDAGKIQTAAGMTVGIGSVGAVIEVAQQAAEAESALATIQRMAFEYWPILVVIAIAILVSVYARRIKRYRIEDAITGRNLGR